MRSSPFSVLVIESHLVARDALCLAIESVTNFTTVSTDSLIEAQQTALLQNPDIILVSLDRDGQAGLQTIANLHRALPGTPLLALTHTDIPHHTPAALASGAQVVLNKSLSRAELIRALQSLLAFNQPTPHLEA